MNKNEEKTTEKKAFVIIRCHQYVRKELIIDSHCGRGLFDEK